MPHHSQVCQVASPQFSPTSGVQHPLPEIHSGLFVLSELTQAFPHFRELCTKIPPRLQGSIAQDTEFLLTS